MSQHAVIPVENQVLYIGLDVHKQSWDVSIRRSNITVKQFGMRPSVQQLRSFLEKHYPGMEYRSVYEAGFTGFSTHRSLESVGISNIVVNAADVPTSDKDYRGKSDPVDSSKLAQALSAGLLSGIAVPTVEQEGLRNLDRIYDQLVGQRTTTKNQIRSFLATYSISVPRRLDPADERPGRMAAWGKEFVQWLAQVSLPSREAREALDLLLQSLACHERVIRAHARLLRAAVRRCGPVAKTAKLLQSIKGIGPISAATLSSELYDIGRFDSFDRLCSYVGLVPNARRSGQSEGRAVLTRRCNHRVRTRLIEAAWVAIRGDSALFALLPPEVPGVKVPGARQRAIVKVARKLLERIWIVWRRQTPWRPAEATATTPTRVKLTKVKRSNDDRAGETPAPESRTA